MRAMKILTAAAVAAAAATATGAAISPAAPAGSAAPRPCHTYSIVARDSASAEMGVAVQSHWFSVGSVVTWGEAGVGVVATQSFADPAYGPRGLQLMRSGVSAPDALRALVALDAGEAVRQVAFVDAAGRVGVHTGARCIEWAGHHDGPGYSAQANLMLNDRVVPAMSRAYESAAGDLAERLVAALEAGEAAGGDIRGSQSAALLVVRGESTGRPWEERVVDLRVEDHADPIGELRRLLGVHRAYAAMNRGDAAMEKGDMPGALAAYREAGDLLPGMAEVRYWQAVTLATNGRIEDALPIFHALFQREERWVEVTRRLVKPGLIPDTPEGRALLARILAEAPAPRRNP